MDIKQVFEQSFDLLALPHRFNFVATLLFAFETYHALSHFCVLFRVRLLPKRDLVRLRYYFLIDLLTVSCSALYTREVLWLALLQNLQHAFFFLTWNKNSYCISVINWSSLDWFVQPGQPKDTVMSAEPQASRVDIGLGTAFDMIVHIVYMYFLVKYITLIEVVVGFTFVAILSKFVLFNRQLAWASPENIPKWVGKRVKPLGPHYTTKTE